MFLPMASCFPHHNKRTESPAKAAPKTTGPWCTPKPVKEPDDPTEGEAECDDTPEPEPEPEPEVPGAPVTEEAPSWWPWSSDVAAEPEPV
ncbi:hypothetical protein JCM33374_g3577 [Metschnikowia sp. JCM 33374]|nr:hypothetical protein JCM33374_g3577 [Metschnikowia sp. JCM 33374]